MFAATLQPPMAFKAKKFFADAIINFLIPFKSISDKNSYDQLFINEVVKIFYFPIWQKHHKILCSKRYFRF